MQYELNCCGYQFWLGRSLVAEREVQRSFAVVLGAQRVFVVQLEILNRYVLNSITALAMCGRALTLSLGVGRGAERLLGWSWDSSRLRSNDSAD